MPIRELVVLPLGSRPSIVKAGICMHGLQQRESFVTAEWVLHYYHWEGSYEIDGVVYEIRPGMMSLFSPDTRFTLCYPNDRCMIHYVHFNCSGKEGQFVRIESDIDCGENSDLRMKQLERVAFLQNKSMLRSEVAFWDMLLDLEVAPMPKASIIPSGNTPIDTVETIIRTEISSKLHVRDICSRIGMSTSHLNRVFRKKHEQSIKEYIVQQRLELARNRLINTNLSVKAIAESIGYSDLQQFNRFIHKHLGCSPRDVRASKDK